MATVSFHCPRISVHLIAILISVVVCELCCLRVVCINMNVKTRSVVRLVLGDVDVDAHLLAPPLRLFRGPWIRPRLVRRSPVPSSRSQRSQASGSQAPQQRHAVLTRVSASTTLGRDKCSSRSRCAWLSGFTLCERFLLQAPRTHRSSIGCGPFSRFSIAGTGISPCLARDSSSWPC